LKYSILENDKPLTNPAEIAEELETQYRLSKYGRTDKYGEEVPVPTDPITAEAG
jgi:hypothetical protein